MDDEDGAAKFRLQRLKTLKVSINVKAFSSVSSELQNPQAQHVRICGRKLKFSFASIFKALLHCAKQISLFLSL